jgi:hypothetical protein
LEQIQPDAEVSNPGQFDDEAIKQVAMYQKIVILCLLGYLIGIALFLALPDGVNLVGSLVTVSSSVLAAVFVFFLSLRVFSMAVGIILAIIVLVPMIGLIPLLVINGKATSVLRAHGYRVGLLGAKPPKASS